MNKEMIERRVLCYTIVFLLTAILAIIEGQIWNVLGVTWNGLEYWPAMMDYYGHSILHIAVAIGILISYSEVMYGLIPNENK